MTSTRTPMSPTRADVAAGTATGELSEWVNRIRAGSGANGNAFAARNTTGGVEGNAEMDLEEEVRQSRLDRQRRRHRLSGQGVRGFDAEGTGSSPQPSPSQLAGQGEIDTQSSDSAANKEVTLRRLLSTRSSSGDKSTTPSPGGDISTPASTANRASALLSRYGGAAGPTGTANPGTGSSPVSLANFMGGKAAGPRLGKLAGDGRSAPPEASMIDESRARRGVALPGMSPNATAGGKGLASFLEARAGNNHDRSPRDTPAVTSPMSEVRTPWEKSASPYVSSQAVRSRPTSPSRADRTDQTTEAMEVPVRRSTSPSKRPKSPFKAAAQPIATPDSSLRPALDRNISADDGSMRHASTSPIRPEDIAAGNFKSLAPSAPADRTNAGSSDSGTMSTHPSLGMSPAFSSLQRGGSVDRQPTASLTRLKGKGMVGQRLKEAKEREAAAFTSTSQHVPDRITFNRTQSHESSHKSYAARPASPTREHSSTSSSERRWSPQKSGNALPGLFKEGSSAGRPTVSASNRSPSPVRDAQAHAPPVRLPGMGGPTSPFTTTGGQPPSPVKSSADSNADQPLEHLTAARARRPARKGASSAVPAPNATQSPTAVLERTEISHVSSENIATPSKSAEEAEDDVPLKTPPLRSTSGPRIVVLISGSGSNLQALIDATQAGEAGAALSKAQICFVLSNRKAAYGLTRARTSNPPIATDVLALKTWQNRNPGGTREQYDEVLAKTVLNAEGGETSTLPPPDLIVLAGFMHIVSPVFLRALGHKTDLPSADAPSWRPKAPVPIINLHPALPGAFDGANAIPRAFEAFQEGEVSNTGIMVHEVVAEVDRGAPVLVREVPIFKADSLEQLEDRMHAAEHRLIVEATAVVLKKIRNGVTQTQRIDVPTSLREAARASDRTSVPTAALDSTTPPVSSSTGTTQGARPISGRKRTGSRPASVYDASLASVPERQSAEQGGVDSKAGTTASQRSRRVRIRGYSGKPSTSLGLSSQDIKNLLAAPANLPRHGAQSLSAETLLIHSDGSSTTVSPQEAHILHEGETQAIVHRFKATLDSETVQTRLYARYGRLSPLALPRGSSSREARKLADLAIRFNAKVLDAQQGHEPLELARIFPAGMLETRLGQSRQSWDSEDLMMWQVRCPTTDTTFVDQVDLQRSSLCSASCFVLSVLGTKTVWHGRGAIDAERDAARRLAHQVGGANVVEVEEGGETPDFLGVLEGESYASAWLHRRRRAQLAADGASAAVGSMRARLFLVGAGKRSVEEFKGAAGDGTFTSSDAPVDGVSVAWLPASGEAYVLVGPDARSDVAAIGAGLALADAIVALPRMTTAHVVIYPSMTPRDLSGSVRYWSSNEGGLRRGASRLNVLSLATAKRELAARADRSVAVDARLVEDKEWLPLGVGVEDVEI